MKCLLCCCLLLTLAPAFATAAGNPVVLQLLLRKARPKTAGFATTAGGDTLRGYFLIDAPGGVLFSRDSARASDSLLKRSSLRAVFLKVKTERQSAGSGFAEYDYLPAFGRLYRKVYAGRLLYFDESGDPENPALRGDVVIAQPGLQSSFSIASARLGDLFKGPFRLLVDRLNSTFATAYHYRDFKTSLEVIRAFDRASEERPKVEF